uniref:Uncharacterized protein n=1 Tax=Globisporangium ultimum (strain ATCC 200006 / CBS 805.95 / DAOM BR144) TaxID=431595 RepID=K3X4P4_GLOUD
SFFSSTSAWSWRPRATLFHPGRRTRVPSRRPPAILRPRSHRVPTPSPCLRPLRLALPGRIHSRHRHPAPRLLFRILFGVLVFQVLHGAHVRPGLDCLSRHVNGVHDLLLLVVVHEARVLALEHRDTLLHVLGVLEERRLGADGRVLAHVGVQLLDHLRRVLDGLALILARGDLLRRARRRHPLLPLRAAGRCVNV